VAEEVTALFHVSLLNYDHLGAGRRTPPQRSAAAADDDDLDQGHMK